MNETASAKQSSSCDRCALSITNATGYKLLYHSVP